MVVNMKVALFLCAVLTVTLVGVFPGEGPGKKYFILR